MIKVKIVMDEEKFHAEKKYDSTSLWETIDKAFLCNGMIKEEKGVYRGVGKDTDFAYLGLGCINLGHQDWFLHYVKEWWWMNSDMGKDENDFSIENLLVDGKIYRVGFRGYKHE